jgi:hypothetical protein
VKEATGQDEVEQAIFNEIHGERFYLAEQAPICKGKLRGDFGYTANTPAAQEALAGMYEFPLDCHEGTKDLIMEAAQIRKLIPANSVDLYVDTVAWRSKWNPTDERTSSSESGLHFGHHIAGAQSNLIAQHHALKSSICLQRGFSLERWSTGLSCMLEKIAGCCIITKLRAILLMEADFNANNKLIFGKRMLDNARKYGLMAEEIYSEAGKTAEDGALAKELFYNIVRQCRLTAAISCIDAANCYDSIAQMQNSLMNWGNLIIGLGGSSKPIKCFYSLVSFKWDRMGKWSYKENHDKEEFQMVVPLPNGSVKEIEHVPISEPKETLGVFTCPNGNPSGALLRMKGKAQEWIDRAKEGKLTRRDVWFLLDVSFWPSVGYGLCVNTAEHDLLQLCLKKQYWQLWGATLTKMTIN